MFKEIQRDLGIARPDHGYLVPWARRGVLLLNSVLTVEEGRAGSHQGKGWEGFTDHVVETLNRECEGLVFLLWGAYAQRKGAVREPRRHRVLKTTRPSPLSAHRGFLGCGHFSAANASLARNGQAPLTWSLPPRAHLETACRRLPPSATVPRSTRAARCPRSPRPTNPACTTARSPA